MKRLFLVGALAAALSTAACTPGQLTPADLGSLANAAAATSPTLPPSAVVSEVLDAAGVTPTAQAAVNSNIATVQKAAIALCRIKPLASGLLNIGIALSPSLSTVASSGVAQKIGGVATIACNALATAPVYTSMGRGQLVRAVAHINGRDVPIYGIRTR
jgi:hypothetical protein